jgi:preprotein translocase subunit SecF
MKYDIIGKRFWFFLISAVLIVVSIASLATFGLKPGIEFSSGSILTVQFDTPVDYDQFQEEITALGYTDAIVQRSGENRFLIRTGELTDAEKAQIEGALTARFGQVSEAQFNSVSPMVAAETTRNASIAVAIAMVGMLLYVTWAFRRMPSPFRWGTCFVIALLHDLLVTVGIFSLLGGLLGWEINLMFITGLLAIVGVSLDNTIVVFDRMRENMMRGVSADFEIVANNSQIETLGRSMNTSLTILITTLALLLFVGATIQNFVVTFLVGLVAGTFDSVFVAPGLLVVWNKSEWGRFIPFRRTSPEQA